MAGCYMICTLVLGFLFHYSLAKSRITLKATPSIINPGVSPSLKLRCTVNRNSSSTAPIVGRRDILSSNARQVEADITHITSIVVTRTDHVTGANDTIATVTTFDPATAHQDVTKLNVIGTTNSHTPGEQGYLELTWSYPTAHQYGIYTCEVFALNAANHPEDIVQAVQIGITEPTPLELILYIADLERRMAVLEHTLSELQGQKVETGAVACNQGTSDHRIVFSRPFTKIPVTVTALAGASSQDSYITTPQIINLTSAGFTLRCTSYLSSSVVWIAL